MAASCGSRRSLGWWLLAGLGLGAALGAKYTAVLLPLGVVLAFLARPSLRAQLACAGPYLACGVALLLFAPVVLWNYQHEWLSFRHQLGHGFGPPNGSPLTRELGLLGGQLAMASPLLFVLLSLAVGWSLRWTTDERCFVLAVVALTTVGLFAVSALRRPVHANWPALAYLPATVLLAVTAGGRAWDRCFTWGCALGAVSVLFVYLHAAYPFCPYLARALPPGPGHGWSEVAACVQRSRAALPGSGGSAWVAANSYQDAAALAFFLPDHPTVFSLNIYGRGNQYDLWPGFAQSAAYGDTLLLVLEEADGPHPAAGQLAAHFERVHRGPLVELRAAGHVVSRRRVWVLEGWRGSWPGRAGATMLDSSIEEMDRPGRPGLSLPCFPHLRALSSS
jgi:hypothetical protein